MEDVITNVHTSVEVDMKSTIKKIGNSQGVILPSGILKALGLGLDDTVEMVLDHNEVIISKTKQVLNVVELSSQRSRMVKQGDILLLDYADAGLGHEQPGRRPVLVVSTTSFVSLIPGLVWVLPITSKQKAFPLHLDLPRSLKTSGQLLCHQIKTMDLNARSFEYLETVPSSFFQEVFQRVLLILIP
jgi:mRNA-degrading endonuclease toxin of MazEF toxin-antitoxin module